MSTKFFFHEAHKPILQAVQAGDTLDIEDYGEKSRIPI